jgi:hypothetical protein
MLLVAIYADIVAVQKVMETFGGGYFEATVLFFPYMLYVGTASLLRRFHGTEVRQRRNRGS